MDQLIPVVSPAAEEPVLSTSNQGNELKSFTCQFCNRTKKTRRYSHHFHENHCKMNPNRVELRTSRAYVESMKKKVYTCQFCKRNWVTVKRSHTMHENFCEKNPNRAKFKQSPALDEAMEKKSYTCRFCGKTWITLKRSHALHEKFCEKNPNKAEYKRRPPSFVKPRKMEVFTCRFCGQSKTTMKAWHERHELFCEKNPNRMTQEPSSAVIEAKKKSNFTCQFCGQTMNTRKCSHTYHEKHCKKNPRRIPRRGHPLSEETKRKLSIVMRSLIFRRMSRHPTWYHGILYDSSWEVEFAKRLEELKIEFDRPLYPLFYLDDEGKRHQYYPDFYLVGEGIYVEIKNRYLYDHDPKVRTLIRDRDDILWLTSLPAIRKFSLSDLERFCSSRSSTVSLTIGFLQWTVWI